MTRIFAALLLATQVQVQSPTVPIMGYQYNFPNGMQCAMVVAPPDTEMDKMPTYILWAGRGDSEIATRQTIFHSAYEASKYAEEYCRVTPRWAKEAK
jgi:hypothetical protein